MRWVTGLLIATIGLLGYVAWRVSDLDRLVVTYQENKMQTMTSTWVSGKTTHVCSTTKNTGESDAAWAARHAASLTAMQTAFPPNP